MKANSVLDFELRKRFMEALKKGRYIVSISIHDPTKKKNEHYAVFQNYPTEDIIPSMEHINRLIFKQLPDEEDNTTAPIKSG